MDKSLLLLSILLPHVLCQTTTTVPSTPQVPLTTPFIINNYTSTVATTPQVPLTTPSITDSTTISTTTAPLDVVHFHNGSGTFASTDFVPSDRAVEFSFVIHTVAPYVIKVKFEWLNLMNHSSCVNESLTVLDGEPGSGDPESLVVLCGTGRGSVPPHSLKSTGQSLSLVLNSTGPLEGRGFNVSYLYVAATRTNQDCGVETGGWANPWSALLYLGASNPVCEATLISPQWLITTASCFNNRSLIPGDWLAEFNNNTGYTNYSLGSIAQHPKFNASTWDYDVALVRLVTTVSLSDQIRPACLPHRLQQVPLPGKSCSVRGSAVSNRVSIMEQSECQVVFNATVTSRKLCASYDMCGEHTSPLLCKEVDGRQYVTGVGGRGSCGPISTFNRVWRVLSFINQTIY
ncbi:serine protease 55-like isoform X2 [Lethenteron reissneri]|uniref:serine protease 55-like isoform X2 n=1 Tax=Lethenteron reissneri TaxID=7753 RepID=UPI002AB684D5|nr:serine protease 55-like isoform X2 [Lethenteron reissneri]